MRRRYIAIAPASTGQQRDDAPTLGSRRESSTGPLPGLGRHQQPGHGAGQVVQGAESGHAPGPRLRKGEPR